MNRLRIAPIVEGHGDSDAVRILLQRIWTELLGGEYADVVQPIRGKRMKLVQTPELARALNLAVLKLRASAWDGSWMILVLLDADNDPPCILGPDLLTRARAIRADADVSCVIANVEYETWFVAAAESLSRFLHFPEKDVFPEEPEKNRQGKNWIQRRYPRYSPTVDQPAMTQEMDLAMCRSRSSSFDKLCRELEARLRPVS